MTDSLITPKDVEALLRLEVCDLYQRLVDQGVMKNRAEAICEALERQQLRALAETLRQQVGDAAAGIPLGDGYRLATWNELRRSLPEGIARVLKEADDE
jgi:hypothetical protein